VGKTFDNQHISMGSLLDGMVCKWW